MGQQSSADMLYRGASLQNPMRGAAGLADIPDDVEVIPVQLSAEDSAPSRGLFYRKKGTRASVGVHVMHPRADQSLHYGILPIVRAGYAVLGRTGRWPNNDVDTVHEVLLLDFAAGVRFLHDQGCKKVVLYGSSGGSSLAAFYQAQALAQRGTRLKTTPAGDLLDLNAVDLPPADGIFFMAAHVGEGHILAKMIDPAVVDESDSLATDPDLDMYDPRNGFVSPPTSSRYSSAFLTAYRAAQAARMRRLDALALGYLARKREANEILDALGDSASLAQKRASVLERHMIVYRTTADPAFVDLHIEPDGRSVYSYFTRRPDLENFRGDGFARYITPRAWLSTWSQNYSNADTTANLSKIATPFLIVHYSGDCGTRRSEIDNMLESSASNDKKMVVLDGVDHYGLKITKDGSKGARATEGVENIIEWLRTRFPL